MSPLLGWLCDRVGPRRVVVAGGTLVSLALVADSAIERAVHLYLSFGLLTAVGVAAAGWVPAVVLVQRWFAHRLGLALGITGSGIGMGIFLVVPLCQALIVWLGWRWAFRSVAVLTALWIIPLTALLIRDPSESAGPRPPAASGAPGAPGFAETSLAMAVRTAPFWCLAVACSVGELRHPPIRWGARSPIIQQASPATARAR
jgi:MFS family permease